MNFLETTVIIGLAIILSIHAKAESKSNAKCSAEYGEGYSWLTLALDGPWAKTATVSVPYGPRGFYVSQRYDLKTWNCLRHGCSFKFEKHTAQSVPRWEHFFPETIVFHDYAWVSKTKKQLEFKGETLDLDCHSQL